MKGSAPIDWGSKTTRVRMSPGPDLDSLGGSHRGLDKPTCHPDMQELHADISSAAAVACRHLACNEFLHLPYVSGELGMDSDFPTPITLEVDNATAITFSKDTVRRSKLRHIDSRQCWVEALRDERIIKLAKVATDENLADLNSKLLDAPTFLYLRGKILRECAIPVKQVEAKEEEASCKLQA